jgi:hypothetical protein
MCVCDGAQLHLLLSSTLLIADICCLFLMPQWEFQVGPSIGIAAADQLWAARYILERITEIAGVVLSLDPKPIDVRTQACL